MRLFILFTLLSGFQLKHFIADYVLQGRYMLRKFDRTGWLIPLASHAAVHGLFTFFISAYTLMMLTSVSTLKLNLASFILAAYDFVQHFTMDRIKSSPNLLGRYKDKEKREFWLCLGFDQMVHHLSDLLIVFFLIKLCGY